MTQKLIIACVVFMVYCPFAASGQVISKLSDEDIVLHLLQGMPELSKYPDQVLFGEKVAQQCALIAKYPTTSIDLAIRAYAKPPKVDRPKAGQYSDLEASRVALEVRLKLINWELQRTLVSVILARYLFDVGSQYLLETRE